MSFEAAIEARLRSDVDLTALVGNQIRWERRVEALPAITLAIAADERPQHLKGQRRWRWTTVQFDIWGRDAEETRPVEARLIALLIVPTVIGGVRFQRATIGVGRTIGELQQGSDRQRGESGLRAEPHRRNRDIRFFHDGD